MTEPSPIAELLESLLREWGDRPRQNGAAIDVGLAFPRNHPWKKESWMVFNVEAVEGRDTIGLIVASMSRGVAVCHIDPDERLSIQMDRRDAFRWMDGRIFYKQDEVGLLRYLGEDAWSVETIAGATQPYRAVLVVNHDQTGVTVRDHAGEREFGMATKNTIIDIARFPLRLLGLAEPLKNRDVVRCANTGLEGQLAFAAIAALRTLIYGKDFI